MNTNWALLVENMDKGGERSQGRIAATKRVIPFITVSASQHQQGHGLKTYCGLMPQMAF